MISALTSRVGQRCSVRSGYALWRCFASSKAEEADTKLFSAFLKQASGPVTTKRCTTEQELSDAARTCSSLTLLQLMPELLHEATRHMNPSVDYTSEWCKWTAPSSTGLLHALLLPKDIPWPAFEGSKFVDATGKNLLLHRTVQHSLGTDAAIMNRLCDRRRVAGIGAAGIGKTVVMDYLLFRCMQSWRHLSGVQQQTDEDSSLGVPNFPFNRIIYRRGTTDAFKIERHPRSSSDPSCSSTNNSFQLGNDLITVSQFEARTLLDLDEYCSQFKRDKSTLLLLELEEYERDPIILLPCFVTTSSRDAAHSTLKTFFKSRSTALLFDPWSFTEVYLMALAMDVASQTSGSGGEVVRTMRDRVTERFPICGGILRTVFERYDIALDNSSIETALMHKHGISVYNIPPSWKGMIAPFALPGVTAPFIKDSYQDDSKPVLEIEDEYGEKRTPAFLYKMRFLSPFFEIRFASYEVALQDIRTFQNLDIQYLIHQAVVLYGGLLRSSYFNQIPESMRRDNWEWHKVGSMDILAKDEVPDIPWANHMIKFNDQVLPLSISSLDQQGVYASVAMNGYVYDFMQICGKHIYLYKVMAKSPKDHPISLYALHRVLNALFPDRNVEKDYKMTYVMIIPSHTSCSTTELEYKGYDEKMHSCRSSGARVLGDMHADMEDCPKKRMLENYDTLVRADTLFENRFYIIRAVLQQCPEQQAVFK